MSKAVVPSDSELETELDEFLEQRRETLEEVANGDYAFSEYAERLLASIDGGGD